MNEKGFWFTTDTGTHIFVEEGQSVEEAVKKRFKKSNKLTNFENRFSKYGEVPYEKAKEWYEMVSGSLDEESEAELKNSWSQRSSEIYNEKVAQGEQAMNNFEKLELGNETLDEALDFSNGAMFKNTNSLPNNDPKRIGTHTNCQRCVQAYVLRSMGYDVQAKETPVIQDSDGKYMADPDDPLLEAGWNLAAFVPPAEGFEIHGNMKKSYENLAQKRQGSKFNTSKPETQIKNISNLVEADENSIYMIGGDWKDGGSHVFIAQNINGKCRFLDPQSGDSDVSRYFSELDLKSTTAVRVDNLKPSKNVEMVVKNSNEY